MKRNIEEILEEGLNRLLKKARVDADVYAVILFGSVAKGISNSLSDVDVCIVLNDKLDFLAMSLKKLEYLSLVDYDVSIFQQLPLYIRHRVMKEGKVLFYRNEDRLYELAIETMKEFEDFKRIYHEYLEGVVRA